MTHGQLLADTSALLWYSEGSGKLSSRSARVLDAALEGRGLFASVVSLYEIGLLLRRGRLRKLVDVRLWVRWVESLGLILLPLEKEVTLEATFLPDAPPRDPFDQLLIATARVHGLTLATRDGAILDYAAAGHLRALEV